MIDDMASLKQAMEQMDAQDPAVADAAKDRAAQILGNAKLSFSKMAELIEQRRLLLRPKIVANIKRMDQPDMLGDAAFRDAGSALRREGQSFRQIAEAIELNGRAAPRREDPVQTSEPLHQMEMAIETGVPVWLKVLAFIARIVFFPVRHPLRFTAIGILAILLFSALRGFTGVGQQISGFVDGVVGARERVDKAMLSVSSFVDRRISPQSKEAAPPPTPPASIPSPPAAAPSPPAAPSSPAAAPSPPSAIPSAAPATASAPPVSAPAPSANESAPSAPSPAAPAGPPVSTPRLDAKGTPSRSAANDRPRMVRPRALGDLMPERIRRNSRSAGPCIGGAGGCYWGGGQY
jgi:hypothetical protein